MNPEPQQEHKWLLQMVGDWICEGEAPMEPGKPPVKWTTPETVRAIGDVWIVGESKGEMPEGGTATTQITLGFDPKKKKYVGSFIGSMMTNMWIYEGSVDASGKSLILDTEGPKMSGEGHAKYQDIMEIKSPDERVLRSMMQGDDGKWSQVMVTTYRRKK